MNKIGNYRWRISSLLFFATTINYLDRQVISLLKPLVAHEFGWDGPNGESNYMYVHMAFQASYAIGLLGFGGIIDRIGTKLGYTISIIAWSVAAMMHALATGTMSFAFMRALLGLGESGNFPAAIKTTAEWFPKNERALATGIFNSGANIGAVVAPVVVPWIFSVFGWQMVFIATGAVGFIWLIFWWLYYEVPSKQKNLSKEEFDYIHADMDEKDDNQEPVKWARLFKFKQTYAFLFGKLLTDPIWWILLTQLPSYFKSQFGLDLGKPSLELVVVYTATTVGSIGGGWLSGMLINKGWAFYNARKVSMLGFALAVVPIMLASFCDNIWQAVGLISLAAAAHQAWSANIYSIATDMFPKKAVSSVIGIGGMAGSVGGIIFFFYVGSLLDHFKSINDLNGGYNIIFLCCGPAYLIAWAIIYMLAPKLETAKIDD